MSSTAEQMRDWRGPALLSYGFRPFFFGAGLWAAVAMALWVPMLNGRVTLPTAFDPVSWHAHEFLFGYVGAVVAGFLLTAVPNWTGRLSIVGWPLGGLFALWVLGRVAVAVSAQMSPVLVAVADLLFLVVLAAAVAREIVRGRNWRNLIVLGMVCVLILANAIFHWEAARGDYAAQGVGLRLGLGAGIMMIAVIGGRIVPSFTRNWLVKRRSPVLPVPPMQRFDKLALLILVLALLPWITAPFAVLTGTALLLAGGLHLWRLVRWRGHRTGVDAGLPFEAVELDGMCEADVIISITSSFEPVLATDHVAPGCHVACMGTDTKGKQEVAPELVAKAAVFTDEIAQSASIGEAQHAIAAGLIGESDTSQLGAVINGTHPGRGSEEEITIFDGTGVGLQDLAVAAAVVALAQKHGKAVEVEF